MRNPHWLIAIATACAVFTASAHADDYPSRQIRVIVPYPAGGSADAMTRLLGPRLSERLKQPVIVENRPGAASVTGTKLMADAPADGYTVCIVANGLTVNPSLYPKMPFDTLRDVKPVSQITFTPNILVANPGSGIKNLADLVQRSKAGGNKFSSGSIGNGTASHLALERLKTLTGLDILHVPYQGAAPGVVAVLGGHTDLMMANLPDVLQHIRAGKLVGVAVASEARLPSLPDVPTFVEAGYPGFVSGAWYGAAVRSGTPEAILNKLNEALVEIIKQPDVQHQLNTMGLQPVGSSIAEFDRLVRGEIKANADLISRAGIRAD